MITIAIDPGYAARGDGCAIAVLRDGVLLRVYSARPGDPVARDGRDGEAVRVVWECPQVDARTRTSMPAVVALAATGGEMAGWIAAVHGATIERVAPSAWKGSVPKPVAHARMWAVLGPSERDVLGGAGTIARIRAAQERGARDLWARPGARYYGSWRGHDLLDAVGIGLRACGRYHGVMR